MSIKHRFTSLKAEGTDSSVVRPSNWNDGHLYNIPVALGATVTLTNVGASYDAVNVSRGLGRFTFDFTGITEIRVDVSTIHVGTGSLTWQLWNETDAAEVGTIADANNTGWHTRSATFTTNLPTGIKTLRLRVLSSVAADDPIYGGAAILLRKTA